MSGRFEALGLVIVPAGFVAVGGMLGGIGGAVLALLLAGIVSAALAQAGDETQPPREQHPEGGERGWTPGQGAAAARESREPPIGSSAARRVP